MASRLNFPADYDAPGDLLARLREIDPTVELLYAGHDPHSGEHVWWLGSVKSHGEAHDARRGVGIRMLANEERRTHPNPFNVKLAKLSLQGFAMIERYTTKKGPPDGDDVKDGQGFSCSIVEDFAERDWNYRRDQGESAIEHKMGAQGRARAESNRVLRDKLHTDGRDEFARTLRQRRVFGYGT